MTFSNHRSLFLSFSVCAQIDPKVAFPRRAQPKVRILQLLIYNFYYLKKNCGAHLCTIVWDINYVVGQ